ncbi:VOC family protein [Hansschlegelia zhihuaiae]|uniref:VOC family protein n=1 Tax=Hansschlegelia zhihuaiae TaxID=405005 RepID=A0A4Q0MIR9_9HYPH|nr:VOC family protein [Hansschlegelia zhihuaiae]RXF72836.1 VOC family protein [Hansschlegelia zhihuaiae]
MPIEPYLFLKGRAEEAIEFYKAALGAETEALMRFDESPDPVPADMIPGGDPRKIMHASVRIGGARVMLSDGGCSDVSSAAFEGFSLTLTLPDAAAVERTFAALAEGGQVRMPLGPTFFSPAFGMLADRFGVPWTIIAEA